MGGTYLEGTSNKLPYTLYCTYRPPWVRTLLILPSAPVDSFVAISQFSNPFLFFLTKTDCLSLLFHCRFFKCVEIGWNEVEWDEAAKRKSECQWWNQCQCRQISVSCSVPFYGPLSFFVSMMGKSVAWRRLFYNKKTIHASCLPLPSSFVHFNSVILLPNSISYAIVRVLIRVSHYTKIANLWWKVYWEFDVQRIIPNLRPGPLRISIFHLYWLNLQFFILIIF